MRNLKKSILVAFAAISFTACQQANSQQATTEQTSAQSSDQVVNGKPISNEDHLLYSTECITEEDVVRAQRAWGEGIVKIGKVYTEKGDYVSAAEDHIQRFYGYDLGSVLFKPTLASEKQFRSTFDAALSYFVGGNDMYPEDKGFAIKPWSNVRWENSGIINNNCRVAIAMGNYYFTPANGGEDVKVEYTFAYVKDKTGTVRIAAHQSSMPYNN